MGIFDGAMRDIIAAAERRAAETGRENDYIGENGLLYCGICHKHRQLEIDVPLIGRRIVTTMCECEIKQKEQEEAMRKAFEEQERIKRLRRIGITTGDYGEMTFAADDGSDPKIGSIVRRYVEKRKEMQEKNIGLLFHGGTGGGKTFWASCIANAMIDNGVSAMITTIPALISSMQADFESNKADVLSQVSNTRFLVLDDIGFERQTSYAAEKMFEIIDARYRSGNPLIVTTNLSLEEIKNPSSMEYKRAFDRIVEMCTPIYVSADGRRQAIAREKGAEARKILGI